jgi:hypothetical protein
MRDLGLPPSAMRPWVPGSVGRAARGRRRNGPRTGAAEATDGAGGSGYADRPPAFVPLTWHFWIPAYDDGPLLSPVSDWVAHKARTGTLHLIRAQQPRFPVKRLVFDEVLR